MLLKEFVKNFRNHPILFLGTGFSLRFVKNSYTWEELLKKISFDLKENNEYYLDLKYKYKKADGSPCFEDIAEELEKEFNEILERERNGKFKYINDLFYKNMEKDNMISRFKIYVSKIFESIEIKEEKVEEIKSLKKIRKNIGSIITTNYDKLIEDVFEFVPLIGNDILLSNPYGAVYKIHGCVTQPEKIILTTKDYECFDKKYELIRAQLLSLFIHNPIIFLGYSISDENIRKILKTIFTYIPVNSKLANKVKKNFLLVEYDNGSENIEVIDHDIVLDSNTTIRVNKIKTDNFMEIYSTLANLELPISAMDIRKVQKVVKDIYEGGSIKVSVTNNIDKLENEDKILVIGNKNTIKYTYASIGEMLENYFKIIEEENSRFLDLVDKQSIQSNQYFTMFGFEKINSKIKKLDKLKKQQVNKIKGLYSKLSNSNKKEYCSIDLIVKIKDISEISKTNTIIYNILNEKLNLDEVEDYLKNIKDKRTTNYRKLLCVYDLMKYCENKDFIRMVKGEL